MTEIPKRHERRYGEIRGDKIDKLAGWSAVIEIEGHKTILIGIPHSPKAARRIVQDVIIQ